MSAALFRAAITACVAGRRRVQVCKGRKLYLRKSRIDRHGLSSYTKLIHGVRGIRDAQRPGCRKGRMRGGPRRSGQLTPRSGRAGPAERVVRDEYNLKQGHVMLDRIVVLERSRGRRAGTPAAPGSGRLAFIPLVKGLHSISLAAF